MRAITLSYPKPGPGRLPVIDELRGLAILLVVAYHTCGVTGLANSMHGELGVDIFIMLSGLALALNNRPEEGAATFLWRRLARLLPVYWIALTLYWQGGIHLLDRVHTRTDVLSHYFCINGWWGDQYLLSINDSFWFLTLIVVLYVVFAVLRRFLERLDIVVGAGLIFSFGLACLTFYIIGQPALFVHVGLRPASFFAGIVLGVLLRDGVARLPLTGWLGLGVGLTFYGMFYCGILIGYMISGVSIFLAYFIARANADAAGRRPLCRFVGWLGVYSYEIFLLHQPLIREYNFFVWDRLRGAGRATPVELAVGVAIALLVTLVLAFLLHHFGTWLGRLLSPRTRPVAADSSR